MYAKWIHPKKIIPFEGDILRYEGKISVNPNPHLLSEAGYYPVIATEGKDMLSEDNFYLVKNKEIHILTEEDIG